MIESNRFLNSGENSLSIAIVSSSSLKDFPKPIAAFACSAAPAFVVIIIITFLKSTDLPLWSVNLP